MSIANAKFMTFNEWKEQNEELVNQIEQERKLCLECFGSGEIECPHCCQDMECEECNGTGYIGISALDVYKELLEADKKKLESYLKLVS